MKWKWPPFIHVVMTAMEISSSAKNIGGEIGAKDKQFAMIKTTQARIRKDVGMPDCSDGIEPCECKGKGIDSEG
jgi:hypothetical protein